MIQTFKTTYIMYTFIEYILRSLVNTHNALSIYVNMDKFQKIILHEEKVEN